MLQIAFFYESDENFKKMKEERKKDNSVMMDYMSVYSPSVLSLEDQMVMFMGLGLYSPNLILYFLETHYFDMH